MHAKKNANDFRRLIKTVSCTGDGEIAEKKIQDIDYEYIRQEERFDGFYAISTNLSDEEPSEIANANHQRWQIEQCFRIMKSEFKSRPVYVRTDARIKAHFLNMLFITGAVQIPCKKITRQLFLRTDLPDPAKHGGAGASGRGLYSELHKDRSDR